MNRPENKERMHQIHQMLIELSRGNFAYRIPRTDQRDEIEALSVLINSAAEEMQSSFRHQSYVNMHDSFIHYIPLLILLDKKVQILEINPNGGKLLQRKNTQLKGLHFSQLLTSASQQQWKVIQHNFHSGSIEETHAHFRFRLPSTLSLPLTCMVLHFPASAHVTEHTAIVGFETTKKQTFIPSKISKLLDLSVNGSKKRDDTQKDKIVLHHKEIEEIRKLGEDIKDHPELALLHLQDLSHKMGINEFKLKTGFRQLYGVSVFQFQRNERFRKAYVLIQHSDLSFKEIAGLCGFRNATHFSNAFHKHFKITPRALRNASKQ